MSSRKSFFYPSCVRPVRSRRRASLALIMVIVVVAVAVITGSLLRYGLTEKRLNRSDQLYAEARLAAEAALNHGMAQLRNRFDRLNQMTQQELQPDQSTALTLSPRTLELLGETRAVVPEVYERPLDLNAFQNTPTVVGAILVNGGAPRSTRIDPFTLLPEQGATGLPTGSQVREVRIYAKATVRDPISGTREAYVSQTLQVIDRTIFQNSVFFNGLLEIFPGAGFNLGRGGGPIYADRIHIGGNPAIHTRVETSGQFTIGRYHNPAANATDSARLSNMRLLGSATANSENHLVALIRSGRPEPLKIGGEDTPLGLQTGVDRFREIALQDFNGGLLTSEHGITGQAAVGLEFIRELTLQEAASGAFDDANGNFDQGLYDRTGGNFGHLLIAPPRQLTDTSTITDEIERSREEAFNAIERNKWSTRSSLVLELDPATDTVRLFHQPIVNGEPQFDALGRRVRQEIDVNTVFPNPATRFWTVERFNQPGGADTPVTGGLYDRRQAGGDLAHSAVPAGQINLVRVDIAGMRRWVEETWTAAELGAGGPAPVFNDAWWNGGVYVQMPETSVASTRPDRVIPAVSNWAVQLHNGQTLPNRFVRNPVAPRGLTVSTNGALYVQGHYNAPDPTSWNRLTYAKDPGAEVPAALVADAVIMLSNSWSNSNSGYSQFANRRATPTTHSAAIVAGNVPSNRGANTYSGGLENFPRYLEEWNWGGTRRTHTYRGSFIRLFRSESFTRPLGGNRIYGVPVRDWSFHEGFRIFPPVPDMGSRIYRKIHFRELSAAEFRAETASLFGGAGGTNPSPAPETGGGGGGTGEIVNGEVATPAPETGGGGTNRADEQGS